MYLLGTIPSFHRQKNHNRWCVKTCKVQTKLTSVDVNTNTVELRDIVIESIDKISNSKESRIMKYLPYETTYGTPKTKREVMRLFKQTLSYVPLHIFAAVAHHSFVSKMSPISNATYYLDKMIPLDYTCCKAHGNCSPTFSNEQLQIPKFDNTDSKLAKAM